MRDALTRMENTRFLRLEKPPSEIDAVSKIESRRKDTPVTILDIQGDGDAGIDDTIAISLSGTPSITILVDRNELIEAIKE